MAWLWLAKDRVCSSGTVLQRTEIPQQENSFLKRYEGVVVLWFTTLSLCQIQLIADVALNETPHSCLCGTPHDSCFKKRASLYIPSSKVYGAAARDFATRR